MGKKKPGDQTDQNDDLEDEEIIEESEDTTATEDETETEEEVTEDTDAEEEDDLPDDPKALKAIIAKKDAALKKVTKESVKRKKQIRELKAGKGTSPETPTEGTTEGAAGDKELQKQLAAERKKNTDNEAKLRLMAIGDLVDEAMGELKFALAGPAAKKDIVALLAEDLEEEDLEDVDVATIKDAIKTQLKSRPYLKATKKVAPDINATRRGGEPVISDAQVEEVAKAFNLDIE